MHLYRAYGVGFGSPVVLPGFATGSQRRADDYQVLLPGTVPEPAGEIVRRRDEDGNSDSVEVRRAGADAMHLSFGDGARFFVDAGARRIDGAWDAPLNFDDALVYLVGPVLGAALRLQRRSVLHASSVEVEGRALVLMGDAGAGKSTTTAALVDAGSPLLTEDVSALDLEGEVPRVFRGGTRVKLWPESVRALRGRDDALPLLVPASLDWHKRFLDCSERMSRHDSLPIAAIVSLERSITATEPVITPIKGHDKLLLLLANGYGAHMVRPDDRTDELSRLSKLAQRVPIARLSYPDRLDALPAAVAALRKHAAELEHSPEEHLGG